jgi:uracil-DNA glycosylase family 4
MTLGAYHPMAHGAHCHVCPLKGLTVVPPAPATSTLKLIIVGEGPGRVEEKLKTPFVGPSGKFLDTLLQEQSPEGAVLPRTNIHVTNAMLCRGESDKDNAIAEICCGPRLLRELAGLPKDIPISVLGKAAAKSVLGIRSILMARGFVWTAKAIDLSAVKALKRAYDKTRGIVVMRGVTRRGRVSTPQAQANARLKWLILKWRRRLVGRTVFPSIHPAFVMRADTWKPILELDMRRTLRAANGEVLRLRDVGPYAHVRTLKEFQAAEAVRWMGPIVAVDIETDGIVPLETKMLCIGISDGRRTVVVDPRQKTGDDPVWPKGLVASMQKFLEGRKAVVMHNGYNFDQIVMRHYGFDFGGVVE